jgi:RNA polymerase sigma-70 factor (ECF subfamily)
MLDPTQDADFADFIRRVRLGDETAAESLIRRYEPEIRLEIRTWLRLRDPRLRRVFDSMDICQSVLANFFVRAAVGEFELEEPSQLIRLLVGMARNSLAEQVRFHQRQRRDVRRTGANGPEAVHAASTDESPSQWLSRRELLQLFRERLSDDERRVADLRAQGLDWAAVAVEIGGTPEACRKQLSRAVSRVSVELGLDSTADA